MNKTSTILPAILLVLVLMPLPAPLWAFPIDNISISVTHNSRVKTLNIQPYLQDLLTLNASSKIVNYAIYGIGNNEILLVYTVGVYTYIYKDGLKLVLRTPIGSVEYLLLDRTLFVTCYGAGSIYLYMVNTTSMTVTLSKDLDTGSLLVDELVGAYYDGTVLELYYLGKSFSGDRYILKIRIDQSTGVIVLDNPVQVTQIIYMGNVWYDTCNYFMVQEETPLNVSIESSGNVSRIKINGKEIMVEGHPAFKRPVIFTGNHYVFLLEDLNSLTLISYSIGNNSFITRKFEMTNTNYTLYGVIPVSDYLSLIYRDGVGRITIIYYNISNDTSAQVYVGYTSNDNILFTKDVDGDGLPDPIVLWKNYFYIRGTKRGIVQIVYWDHLSTPIFKPVSTVLVNGNIYYLIGFKGIFNDYYLKLLFYNRTSVIDTSPPEVIVYSPLNNTYTLSHIIINASMIDHESKVYVSRIILSRDNEEIVLDEYIKNTSYINVLDLKQGDYNLSITSWNIYGYASRQDIIFHVLRSIIDVVYPTNNTYVSKQLELKIASSGNYLIHVEINNTHLGIYSVSTGLNIFDLDISSLTDGEYIVLITVLYSSFKTSILIRKDTVKPVIHVYGITNGTVLSGITRFTMYIYDECLANASAYIDNNELFSTVKSGNYTIILNTYKYNNSWHELLFTAIDQAGNREEKLFNIMINNTRIEHFFKIYPEPPNNTYVSGSKTFKLLGQDIESVTVLIDEKIYVVVKPEAAALNYTLRLPTRNISDGPHKIVFDVLYLDGVKETYVYKWFVDNNPPYLYMRIPVMTEGGPWRNGSVVPTHDPLNPQIIYVESYRDMYTVPLYVNISEQFLRKAVLEINGTIAHVLINGKLSKAVFNRSGAYYVKLLVKDEGFYKLLLEAEDYVGHKSTYTVTFYIDLTPPIVEPVFPANNSIWRTKTIRFSFLVNDNVSKQVFIGIGVFSGHYHKITPENATPAPTWSTPVGIIYNQTLTIMNDGVYYVSFLFMDEGLNYVVKTIRIIIDSVPPTANYTVIYRSGIPVISLNASDTLTNISFVEVKVDDRLVLEKNISLGRYSTEIPLYNLSMGKHVLNITLIDTAGNKAYYSGVFIVNNTWTTTSTSPSSTTTTSSPGTTNTSSPVNPTRSEEDVVLLAIVIISILLVSMVLYYKYRNTGSAVNTSQASSSRPSP